MSKSGSRSSSLLEKSVEQFARRAIATMRVEAYCTKALQFLLSLWFIAIKDVLRLEDDRVWGSMMGRMIQSWNGHTWSDVVSQLKALDGMILDHIEKGVHEELVTSKSFKRSFSRSHTTLGNVEGVLLPQCCFDLAALYIKDHDVSTFRDLHQILCFPTRPDALDPSSSKGLDQEAEDRFMNVDYRCLLTESVYDTGRFFEKYLKDYDPYRDFIPRFSNGSARCGSRGSSFWYDKWKSLKGDDLVCYLEYQIGYEFTRSASGLHRQSSFTPVAKDSTKRRGITVEPSTLAYIQQGFMISLRHYILRHPYLKRRIDFTHSERNCELAQVGSIDGSFSTIDLSDASDSVVWDQVVADSIDLPLYEALLIARSKETLCPSGWRIGLSKYAGMGNALTFTLECLVFCKIVEQGIRDAGGSVSESGYRVYGDDIIVETEYYPSVINALIRNGFKVNTLKSYNGQTYRFRESCGGEYLDGCDVRPVRLPRGVMVAPSTDVRHRSSWIPTVIDIANSCYGVLPSVRLYLIHLTLQLLPERLYPVFTLDGSTGFRSDQPTNFHLKRRKVRKNSRIAGFQYDTVLVHGVLHSMFRFSFVPVDDQYQYKLNQLALRGADLSALDILDPDESRDLDARLVGTVWKSKVGPDYYSSVPPPIPSV